MQRLALFLIVILIPSALADQHSTYWPKDKLAGYSSSLDAKVKDHVAIEELGQFGSHFALMVHRTGTGTSESHAGDTDFYVVQAGEATLHVGGEIVEPETVSPGEGAGHVAQGRPDHGPQGWRYGEHSADDGGRLRRRGQDRDVEQRPRPMVPEPAAPLDPRRSTTMRWKPTYRKLTRPALWFVAAVASGVGAASLAAPGPAEEPVSTRCLAEKGSKAGGGYLDRIKRLSPSIGRISGDVMPMVLVPREAPVSNTEERLIGAAPLVKDRVVLLFFEEHPEGYASLSGTVVRQFAEAGAAAVVALNAEVESGQFDIPVFHTHEASDDIGLNDYYFAGPRMPFVWYGVETRINAGDFAAVDKEGVFVAAGDRKAELLKACGQ